MNPVRRTTLSVLSIFALATLPLAGCDVSVSFASDSVEGSGKAATEERSVDPFEEVQLTGQGRLEVEVGPSQHVELTADDNLMPLIKTAVKGGRLTIRPTEDIDPDVDLVVRISVPSLRKIGCSGAGSIDVEGLAEEELTVSVSGAAKVVLEGRTDRLTVRVSGVGAVDASELVAQDAVVSVSGVGKADVHATGTVDVKVSGVGKVTYRGDPEVTESISGIGWTSEKDD